VAQCKGIPPICLDLLKKKSFACGIRDIPVCLEAQQMIAPLDVASRFGCADDHV
jgi:hypothetical protein